MNGTNYEVPDCGAFSTPHSHPSWAQIFASGSCFQIPLAWIIDKLDYDNKTIYGKLHLNSTDDFNLIDLNENKII